MDFSGKRIIETEVPPENEGIRLDRYLTDRFTYQSRTAWQTRIREGLLKLNGRKTRASRILRAGDKISLEMDQVQEPEVDRNYSILLETPELIAVNKSGAIPVHPSGCYFRNTLLCVLQEDMNCSSLCVVNRLDRETSGITIFAKSPEYAGKLAQLFASRNIHKKYLAFVHGKFPDKVTAEGFLFPDLQSAVRKKRTFSRQCPENLPPPFHPEPCSTFFRNLRSNGEISLVECIPHTGRLHQIRATLYALGFPLVGDKLYGLDEQFFLKHIQSALTEEDHQRLILSRQALHALSLEFTSPFSGEKFFCEAPLPTELQHLQDLLSGCIVSGQ